MRTTMLFLLFATACTDALEGDAPSEIGVIPPVECLVNCDPVVVMRTTIVPVVPSAVSAFAIPGSIPTASISGIGISLMATVPDLAIGERIAGVRARIQDNASGPSKIELRLYSVLSPEFPVLLSISPPSSGTGAVQTLSAPGTATRVASGTLYFVTVSFVTGGLYSLVSQIEVDHGQ